MDIVIKVYAKGFIRLSPGGQGLMVMVILKKSDLCMMDPDMVTYV